MHRVPDKRWLRICGFGLVAAAIAISGAMSGSCVFDTRTTLCEQFGLRCKEGQQCAAMQPVCIDIAGCGNMRIDPGEVCDDGNTVDGEIVNGTFVVDTCNHDCSSTQVCGNGIMDHGEACDHGVDNGMPEDACDTDCQLRSKVCGNNVVDKDMGEECDPGDMDSKDCNSNAANLVMPGLGCKAPKCGDGYWNMQAEECDSGGAITPDCNGNLCTKPTCGDHFTNPMAGEECDTGGPDAKGCNGNNGGSNGPGSCQFPACGDHYMNTLFTPPGGRATENCDNGGLDTPGCNGNNSGNNGPGSCRVPSCGDGYTNMMANEACDNLGGGDTDKCNGNKNGPSGNPNNAAAKCQVPRCGDGYTNAAANEDCDTPDGADSPTCNGSSAGDVSCKLSSCGDGHTNTAALEQCDNLGGGDTDKCNGNKNGPSGNPNNPAAKCQQPTCGDGYTNTAANEDCDNLGGGDTDKCNGNNSGDGTGDCHFPRCGDGYINKKFKPPGASSNEECDPGGMLTSACPPTTGGKAQHCDDTCQCVVTTN